MSKIAVTVRAKGPSEEAELIRAFKKLLGRKTTVDFRSYSKNKDEELSTILLVDCALPSLEEFLCSPERDQKIVILIGREKDELFEYIQKGWADDIILKPFRKSELLSKFNLMNLLLGWRDFQVLNSTLRGTLSDFQKDAGMVERLYKMKLPQRFPSVKGFNVASRYLAGTRPGGDFFDIAESQSMKSLLLFFFHSSNYGLSNRVLSLLMKITAKLSVDRVDKNGNLDEILRGIRSELTWLLGEDEKLSLVIASISQVSHTIRYINLGNTLLFYADPRTGFQQLSHQGSSLTAQDGGASIGEIMLQGNIGGRLVLISEGLVTQVGGVKQVQKILDQKSQDEGVDALNELVFYVKSQLDELHDFPASDCSGVAIDIEGSIYYLPKQEP